MSQKQTLNEREAYDAMYAFLEAWYKMTGSDDVGALLGSLSLTPDGLPADGALWNDWLSAVREAKEGVVSSRMKLTSDE